MVMVDPISGESGPIAHADDSGRFRIRGLPVGRFSVIATNVSDRSTPPVEIEVRAGEVARVDLSFPTGTITLVVQLGDRDCAMITLDQGTGAAPRPFTHALATARYDGVEVELLDLPAGDYRVCLGEECQPITVAASPARQTFDLSKKR